MLTIKTNNLDNGKALTILETWQFRREKKKKKPPIT